jgi:hypothetical protein
MDKFLPIFACPRRRVASRKAPRHCRSDFVRSHDEHSRRRIRAARTNNLLAARWQESGRRRSRRRPLQASMCPVAIGLAAQPVPHQPGRGRTRLRPGRAAGQRQRRRHRARHHLAVAAQSLHPPRPRHAYPQPRGRPPARYRRRPPARRSAGHPRTGPGVCGPQPRRPPGPRTVTGRAVCVGPPRGAVRHLGANVVVELYSKSHARKPTTRAWAIIRRADRSHRLAGQRTSRAERRQADRASRTDRPPPQGRRWLPMPR